MVNEYEDVQNGDRKTTKHDKSSDVEINNDKEVLTLSHCDVEE